MNPKNVHVKFFLLALCANTLRTGSVTLSDSEVEIQAFCTLFEIIYY